MSVSYFRFWVCLELSALFMMQIAFAAPIRLETFHAQPVQPEVLIKGGQFFASRCMQCHGLKYFTHDPIGKAAGVVPSKMPNMDPTSWSGHPPPDLSLIAHYRGVDWLYTYLYSFYQDPSQPTGANNLLAHRSAMPNPFLDLQGMRQLVIHPKQLLAFNQLSAAQRPPWYRVVKRVQSGQLSDAEFGQKIQALVMFLDYVAEPHRAERYALGFWVLGFLAVFFIIAWRLKKAYWKDIQS